jgi:hypothetical protein
MTLEKEKNKDAQSGNARKIYAPPTLSEYGSVSKLTKGTGVSTADNGAGMMSTIGMGSM